MYFLILGALEINAVDVIIVELAGKGLILEIWLVPIWSVISEVWVNCGAVVGLVLLVELRRGLVKHFSRIRLHLA